MYLLSKYTPDAYISALKFYMESPLKLGRPRFTGLFLGRVFYVTYHSGFQHGSKYTNEKNTALAIVRKKENGCSVSCVHFAGLMAPLQSMGFFLTLFICICAVYIGREWPVGVFALRCLSVTAVCACFSCILDSITDTGREGRRILDAYLMDPANPRCTTPKTE